MWSGLRQSASVLGTDASPAVESGKIGKNIGTVHGRRCTGASNDERNFPGESLTERSDLSSVLRTTRLDTAQRDRSDRSLECQRSNLLDGCVHAEYQHSPVGERKDQRRHLKPQPV